MDRVSPARRGARAAEAPVLGLVPRESELQRALAQRALTREARRTPNRGEGYGTPSGAWGAGADAHAELAPSRQCVPSVAPPSSRSAPSCRAHGGAPRGSAPSRCSEQSRAKRIAPSSRYSAPALAWEAGRLRTRAWRRRERSSCSLERAPLVGRCRPHWRRASAWRRRALALQAVTRAALVAHRMRLQRTASRAPATPPELGAVATWCLASTTVSARTL